MEKLNIKSLKDQNATAAKKLESYFRKEGVEFTDERASIYRRAQGLSCRVMGGKKWHRVDWNTKARAWTTHEIG